MCKDGDALGGFPRVCAGTGSMARGGTAPGSAAEALRLASE